MLCEPSLAYPRTDYGGLQAHASSEGLCLISKGFLHVMLSDEPFSACSMHPLVLFLIFFQFLPFRRCWATLPPLNNYE